MQKSTLPELSPREETIAFLKRLARKMQQAHPAIAVAKD